MHWFKQNTKIKCLNNTIKLNNAQHVSKWCDLHQSQTRHYISVKTRARLKGNGSSHFYFLSILFNSFRYIFILFVYYLFYHLFIPYLFHTAPFVLPLLSALLFLLCFLLFLLAACSRPYLSLWFPFSLVPHFKVVDWELVKNFILMKVKTFKKRLFFMNDLRVARSKSTLNNIAQPATKRHKR